jgi:RimJ/RimL family protein N-acetyltransferase
LRIAQPEDAWAIARLRADRALQHLLLASPAPQPPADPIGEAASWIRKREAAGIFRIIAPGPGQVAGFAQVFDIHRASRFGWIGLCLGDEWRGKGIGRVALDALEANAVSQADLRKLLLQVRADNRPAIDLYEKARWRPVGRLQDHYDDGARFHDVLIYEKMLAPSDASRSV